MKKIPAIILLFILTASLLAYLFYTPPPPKIFGCMDRTATNYKITATVDDSSCVYLGQLSKALQDKVDKLKSSDWDQKAYQNLKTDILNYFHSEGKAGTPSEYNELFNLDADYMSVLYKETKKVAKKCFSKSSNLKKEVDYFYKKYKKNKKNNKDIKEAKSIFNNRSKIYSFQKKVRSLLKKEFESTSHQALQSDINNFINSSFYKHYIKSCKGLRSDLQECLDDLYGLSRIHAFYTKQFVPAKKKHGRKWKGGINVGWIDDFKRLYNYKKYRWYYNQVNNL